MYLHAPTKMSVDESLTITRTASNTSSQSTSNNPFLVSLLSGGIAGTSVDIALFPIDTIKTRLQSPQGFINAGGFRGIYRGVGAAAIGSAPGAALFFSVYETSKPIISNLQQRYGIFENHPSFSHMISASIGEVAACLVRVPTEVIKTKMQTNAAGSSTVYSTIQMVLSEHSSQKSINPLGGLYRGFGITLSREIPFAFIQFPIYEYAKVQWSNYQKYEVSPLQSAACGSFGGGIAAALTTPLDVVKTRMMLGRDKHGVAYNGVMDVMGRGLKEDGYAVFFRGIQPRVFWISLGGFVFFGMYETSRKCLVSI